MLKNPNGFVSPLKINYWFKVFNGTNSNPWFIVLLLFLPSTFKLRHGKNYLSELKDLWSGGFDEQLATIFPATPATRQTLLFTATNSPVIDDVIKACPNNPHTWECESVGSTATVDSLEQRYILTPREAKNGYLVQLVLDTREKRPKDSIIVFTKTCKTAELLDRAFRYFWIIAVKIIKEILWQAALCVDLFNRSIQFWMHARWRSNQPISVHKIFMGCYYGSYTKK